MQLNDEDFAKSNEELQEEANNPETIEERVKQILAILLIRTIKDWQDPAWFMEWLKTTPEADAREFLEKTLANLMMLEMYEHCSAVEQMIGQLNVYYVVEKS
jgi:hypothetical protein